MQQLLLAPWIISSRSGASAIRHRAGDGGLPAVSAKPLSTEALAGQFMLRTVGPGAQTLHRGDGSLIAYLAFGVYGPEYEQQAIESGGASIVYQRDDRLEINSCDGRFPKILRGSSSWFLDRIHVQRDAIRRSPNVFRGDGGPLTMSDGTLALAYISGINWSTLYAVGRWANEEVRRRRLRGDVRREFREDVLSDCTRGRIALTLEVRFYPGYADRVPEDFCGGDYRRLRYLLSPVELSHKPFTATVPAVWHQESLVSAHATACVAWDFSDPAAPLTAVSGSSVASGPQRPGRETYEGADIWVFGGEER